MTLATLHNFKETSITSFHHRKNLIQDTAQFISIKNNDVDWRVPWKNY